MKNYLKQKHGSNSSRLRAFALMVLALVSVVCGEIYWPVSGTTVVIDGKVVGTTLPYLSEKSVAGEVFEVKTSVLSLFGVGQIKVVPDDCLQYLAINNRAFDLSQIERSGLCNWKNGIAFPVNQHLDFGWNTVEIRVQNMGGHSGATITRIFSSQNWFLLISAAILSIMILLGPYAAAAAMIIERNKWLGLAAIMLISYGSIVHRYWEPAGFFWDENYHVAAAEKYLQGVYFMEPHPPLGKLFIAAGEKLLHNNQRLPEYVALDIIHPKAPPNMRGYRLFPVLFAWLCCLLLYDILVLATRSRSTALITSILLALDNAYIVHMRSAMLESTLLFFCLAALWTGIKMLRRPSSAKAAAIGLFMGAALATKVLALVMLPLMAPAAWYLIQQKIPLKRISKFGFLGGFTCLLVYILVWQTHFSLGKTIVKTLPDGGFYKASESTKHNLTEGTSSEIKYFLQNFTESSAFVKNYESGVPRLNLCKKVENGSPWYFWPFGGRTINYKWERVGPTVFRYLYLLPNPITWGLALFGVVLALSQMTHLFFFKGRKETALWMRENSATTLAVGLYVSYMVGMIWLSSVRVMYLYHYFIPLILGLIAFATISKNLFNRNGIVNPIRNAQFFLLALVLCLCSFQLNRPLSYYAPILSDSFRKIPSLSIWDLNCEECDLENNLFKPLFTPP